LKSPRNRKRVGNISNGTDLLNNSSRCDARARNAYMWQDQVQHWKMLSRHNIARRPSTAWHCLDYCNSMFYGTTDGLMSLLQSVQNAAARLVSGARRCDHVTPALGSCIGFRFGVGWISRWPLWSTCHCPAWLQLIWPPTVSWSPTKIVVSCILPTQGHVSSEGPAAAMETDALLLQVRGCGTVCQLISDKLTLTLNNLNGCWRHFCLAQNIWPAIWPVKFCRRSNASGHDLSNIPRDGGSRATDDLSRSKYGITDPPVSQVAPWPRFWP